jgi:hypothetical protein
MTPIRFKARARYRESAEIACGRAVCLALEPSAVLVRLKGMRTAYRVPVRELYVLGAKLEARRIMFEKQSRKKK